MKIIKVTPRGFCSGVVEAWKIILQTVKKYENHRIFMLGWFVHNKVMVEEILQNNITVLDDSKTSRYDLVLNNPFQNGDVLILSAHGTDKKTIELAKSIGYIVVDTTCQYVYNTHDVIKQGLQENKTVFYLGKINHPESNASVAIDPKNIKLITRMQDLKDLEVEFKNQPILVTNQTTLSTLDLQDFYDYINNHFNDVVIKNDLCYATQERQNALLLLKEKIDVLIVVGDTRSNNSKQLKKIGEKRGYKTYMVNSADELQNKWFDDNYTVAITSGASTPTKVTNAVIKYLEEWKK